MRNFYSNLLTGCIVAISGLSAAAQVAKIGSADYATLSDAFAAAKDGDVITLTTDVELTEPMNVSGTVTLDLQGHTVTNSVSGSRPFRLNNSDFTINGNGGKMVIPAGTESPLGFVDFRNLEAIGSPSDNLTINDANFEGETDNGSFFMFRADGQSITLNNVNATVRSSYTWGIISGVEPNSATVTISGGNINYESTHRNANVINIGISNSKFDISDLTVNTIDGGCVIEVWESEATFKDCHFTNKRSIDYYSFLNTTIGISGGSKVTIDGGDYDAQYGIYVFNSGGEATINGGSFTGSIASVQADANPYSTSAKATVIINDGAFIGPLVEGQGKDTDQSKIEITGGSFDTDISDYCLPGYTPVKNAAGEWTVNPTYATVNGQQYPTLAEAVDAAKDGETVTLAGDVTLSEPIAVSSAITLNLDGHTLTSTASGQYAITVDEGASLSLASGAVKAEAPALGAISASGEGSTVNVSGGSFEGSTVLSATDGATINVSGGSFSGTISEQTGGTISLTGGSFDTDISAFCAPGYYAFRDSDGTWTPRVAVITGIEAIEATDTPALIIYDLAGRRVKSIEAPGVYIVNGVKTIVR
ncbi:MAG: hypothetical protein NC342_00260 [Pseudoflavonifractor sp.]|nr:hypothetical protein [Alloprevotella sp.]MCM1115960.1 hypothetical protein [Pseudoflavonifractor sp.]